MPYNCSVPDCKGNYKNGPKVSTFRFPKDELLRKKWIWAIRRKDFIPSKSSSVCELHFKKSDIETEISAYDSKTGRTLTAPLGVKRLKKGVIPSLLIPKLNLENSVPSREDPEEKRMRIEEEQLSLALEQSLKNVPGETSQPKDTAESNINSSLPVSRQTGDKTVENQGKKVAKRKRKSENEVISSKKVNSICDLNSVEKGQSTDIQIISQNNNLTHSRNDLSNFIILFQKQDALPGQQTESLSHSQLSSNCDSINTERIESNKNHQVQIKEEKPWEEEYGLSKDKLEDNDMVKIVSVESASKNETTESTSQQTESKMVPEGCDTTFYKKPLKIEKRDEAFGKLVACEMSDLRGNPELYLKTQQSILKLLVEAHFEQIGCV